MLKEKVDSFIKKYRNQKGLLVTDVVADITNILNDITGRRPLQDFINDRSKRLITKIEYMFLKDLSSVIATGSYKELSLYLSLIDSNEEASLMEIIKPDITKSLTNETLVLFRTIDIQEMINVIEMLSIVKESN